MKKVGSVITALMLLIATLLGCTNDKVSNGDWNSHFIVWNGFKYDFKETSVDKEKIAETIGSVESFMGDEGENVDTKKTFSNKYPKGTKLFKIKDTSTDKEIAVEVGDGKYVLGVNTGTFGGQ